MTDRSTTILILLTILLMSRPGARVEAQTSSSSSGCCKIHTASGLTTRIGGRLVCSYDVVGIKTVSCVASNSSACQLPPPGYLTSVGSREGEPCAFTNYIFHQNSCDQETSPKCGSSVLLSSLIQAQ